MMRFAGFVLAAAMTFAPAAGWAQADKPTVSGYLQQGYDLIHIEGGGGQFIFFYLKKDRTVVWCSVLVQSGETTSCRTVK
jgi:hypothetical protein